MNHYHYRCKYVLHGLKIFVVILEYLMVWKKILKIRKPQSHSQECRERSRTNMDSWTIVRHSW